MPTPPITALPIPTVAAAKAAVGLGLADNTPDMEKPVSGPQAIALAAKADNGHTHANATEATPGFMSEGDKGKLNGIATGASANSSDAFLRARENHTGEQAQSTITGLVSALAGKASTAAVAGRHIAIQFKDEGTDLGTAGSVTTIDVVGAGVSLTRTGDTLTLLIPLPTWGQILGPLSANPQLYAALGGTDVGGPSDVTILEWDEDPESVNFGRVLEFSCDGLAWVIDWHADGRPNTMTHGVLVRQFIYDGLLRYAGMTGPKYKAGRLVLTYAQMASLTPTEPGLCVLLSDTYPWMELIYNGEQFRSPSGVFAIGITGLGRTIFGGNGTTYSQVGTLITVTKPAGHTMTDAAHGGNMVHLTAGSGGLVTGWFTNFTYVSATVFTVVSSISQTISGNLGSAAGVDIEFIAFPVKAKLPGLHGQIGGWTKWSTTNDADVKTALVKYGGTTFYQPALTSKSSGQIPFLIQNSGAANEQRGWVNSHDAQSGTSGGGFNTYAINTLADVMLSVCGRLASDTDILTLEGCNFQLQH